MILDQYGNPAGVDLNESFSYVSQEDEHNRSFKNISSAHNTEEAILTSFERFTIISRLRELCRVSPIMGSIIQAFDFGNVTLTYEGDYETADRVTNFLNDLFESIGLQRRSLNDLIKIIENELVVAGEVYAYFQQNGTVRLIESPFVNSDKPGIRILSIYRSKTDGQLHSIPTTFENGKPLPFNTDLGTIYMKNGRQMHAVQVIEDQGLIMDFYSQETLFYRYGFSRVKYNFKKNNLDQQWQGIDFSDEESVLLDSTFTSHIYNPVRPEQRKGVPLAAACINTIVDIHEIIEAVRLKIKNSSFISGIVTTEDPSTAKNFQQSVNTDFNRFREAGVPAEEIQRMKEAVGPARRVTKMTSQVNLFLGKNEKYELVESNGNYGPLMDFMVMNLRLVAAHIGMPLEVVLSLFGNYSSSKQTMGIWKNTVSHYRGIIQRDFLKPLIQWAWYNNQQALGISKEDLKNIGFLWSKVPELDEQSEAAAREIALRSNTKTEEEIALEDGTTLLKRKAAKDKANRMSLAFAQGKIDDKGRPIIDYTASYPVEWMQDNATSQAAAQGAHAQTSTAAKTQNQPAISQNENSN